MAEPIVLTLFGEQWADSAPILQAIAVYAGIRALGSYTGDVLKATGKPGMLAVLGMVRASVLVPLLVVAAKGSALAVAWTLTAVAGVSTGVNLTIACVLLRSSAGELSRALWPGTVSALPLFLFLLVWIQLSRAFPASLTLVLGVFLGVAIYLASVRLFVPELFRVGLEGIRGGLTVQEPKESPAPPLGALP
jgi:O-antigen/teichoic acid export membrane protein